MRKFVIALAASGAALVAATPASAQYYPQAQPYGYNGYGNGYGYNADWRHAREFQARIDRIEWQIDRLDRRNRIGDGRADRLRAEATDVERRLRYAVRDGLNPYEARVIGLRIQGLEQRVQYAMNSRNGYNGYDGRFMDRDRDGRNDRYEDDQGRRHDRDDD